MNTHFLEAMLSEWLTAAEVRTISVIQYYIYVLNS